MGNGIIAAAGRFLLGDIQAPTVPGKPTKGATCQTTLTLSWAASTDNVGVTGYNIYDGGIFHIDAGAGTSENLTGLTAGSSSTWTITAYDAATNESAESVGTSVTQGVTVSSFNMNSTGQGSHSAACADSPFTTQRWKTGGALANGQVIYTNSCGTNKFNGGDNFYSDGNDSFIVGGTGVISSVTNCTA